MTTAREIIKALDGKWDNASSSGTAKCPAHDDKRPSFSVSDKSGKVYFRCHAGCSQDQLIAALVSRGLWETPRPKDDKNRAAPVHPKFGKPDFIFNYYDAPGHLIGIVARWNTEHGKEIRPAVPNGSCWKWKAFPEPRPLYALPNLDAHRDKPVLVVEGEKTVDAARELIQSHVATCWPGGASAVSKANWSPLKGRDVVLWPDADEAGRKAMQDVAAQLAKVGARSVRVVRLPAGLPDGWDIADQIPDDLDLDKLIREAVDVAAERLCTLPIKKASVIDATDYPEIKFPIPGIVPDGVTILAGSKSRGKSFIADDFALAVAGGGLALGKIQCEQGDVLLLALEDGERRIKGRMRAILQGRPVPDRLDIATEWRAMDDGGLEDIEAWIRARPNPRLVIVDVLAKIKGRPDRDRGVYDNDYATIGPFHALARKYGIAIILVHHTNKGAADDPVLRISGTMGLSGAADTTIVLDRQARDPHGTIDVRGRDVPERQLAVQFDADTGCAMLLGPADDFRKTEERRAIIRVLTDTGPMTPREVSEAIGKKVGAVRVALHRMQKACEVVRHADGRYAA